MTSLHCWHKTYLIVATQNKVLFNGHPNLNIITFIICLMSDTEPKYIDSHFDSVPLIVQEVKLVYDDYSVVRDTVTKGKGHRSNKSKGYLFCLSYFTCTLFFFDTVLIFYLLGQTGGCYCCLEGYVCGCCTALKRPLEATSISLSANLIF